MNAPLDTFHENKDNWYKLIRATEDSLMKQGFKLQRSFRHDYMTEEYVIPVEEKMKGGETFTREALVSGLQPIAAAFEKEHYPAATAVAAKQAAPLKTGGRGQ